MRKGRQRLRFRHLLLATPLLVSGCAMGIAAGEGGARQIAVRIANRQFDSLTIYLVRSQVPIRLGVVEGHASRTFWLPPAYYAAGDNLSLRAESSGARIVRASIPFNVAGGQTVHWTVHGSAVPSSLVVW